MTDPQVIVNLGTGGSDLNGQNGSTSSADSNDARFLDWPGDNAGNYVYLPGATGNFLSVPDEAALDITGDIDLRVYVAVDALGVEQVLMAKEQTSVQESWRFNLSSTGVLTLRFSATGTGATSTGVSTVVAPVVAGEPIWLRVTLDVDNGASGRDFKFYTSNDGGTWSQLGATVTQAGTTSIYNSTSIVEVGSVRGGTAIPSTMKVYRAQVLDGIDGTTVLDVDTSVITSGSATSFTAATGQTVTINRSTSGRKSVAVVSPVWLFGTDDRMVVSNSPLLAFSATESFGYFVVIRQWSTPLTNGTYFARGNPSGPDGYWLRSSGASLAGQSIVADGTTQVADSSGSFTGGELVTLLVDVNRSTQRLDTLLDGVSQGDANISSVGAPEYDADLYIGDTPIGARFQDFELIAAGLFRRGLSQTEIDALVTYYENRLS